MEILSQSNLIEVVKDSVYDIDYGTIKEGSDTKVVIDILGANHLKVQKTCGCTMPEITLMVDGVRLTISYDNSKRGVINQSVMETVELPDSTQKTITFRLKGLITS